MSSQIGSQIIVAPPLLIPLNSHMGKSRISSIDIINILG